MMFETARTTAAVAQPPIPPLIRELLSSFPELLLELQDSLTNALIATSPSMFEVAIWAMKDTLGDMISTTLSDISRATEDGDSAKVESLTIKRVAIGKARRYSLGMSDMEDLKIYCSRLDKKMA